MVLCFVLVSQQLPQRMSKISFLPMSLLEEILSWMFAWCFIGCGAGPGRSTDGQLWARWEYSTWLLFSIGLF
jgi:hypothetical protein